MEATNIQSSIKWLQYLKAIDFRAQQMASASSFMVTKVELP